jgi:hypothetical protein
MDSGFVEWLDAAETRIADHYKNGGTLRTFRAQFLRAAVSIIPALGVSILAAMASVAFAEVVPTPISPLNNYGIPFATVFGLVWRDFAPD